jgi:membrane protein implicated in regulation of membrane protease activity
MMGAAVLFFIILAAFVLALVAYVCFSSRHRKTSRLPLNLVGRVGSVERALSPEGFVLVGGELWPARARGGARIGRGRANVRVVGAGGCALEVEPFGRAEAMEAVS